MAVRDPASTMQGAFSARDAFAIHNKGSLSFLSLYQTKGMNFIDQIIEEIYSTLYHEVL